MAQQTAMQTLINWGEDMLLKHPQKILSFAAAIDKAEELLQMEKEQIIKAFNDLNDDTSAEQYYNETYEKS